MPSVSPLSASSRRDMGLPHVVTAILLAAAAAIAAWWAVQITSPRPAIAPAVKPSLAQTDPTAASALFGALASGSQTTPQIRLPAVKVLGVVVHPQRGAALIAVDSAPPRAVAVGDQVSPGLILVAVTADTAVFERAGERIELPAPKRASPELLQSGPTSPSSGAGARPGAR